MRRTTLWHRGMVHVTTIGTNIKPKHKIAIDVLIGASAMLLQKYLFLFYLVMFNVNGDGDSQENYSLGTCSRWSRLCFWAR